MSLVLRPKNWDGLGSAGGGLPSADYLASFDQLHSCTALLLSLSLILQQLRLSCWLRKQERNCERLWSSQQHLLATIFCENLRLERVKSGTKNGPGIRARFWSLLVLAQLPKAQKTGPFLGPHFGAGKPLLSSFLELQNLDTDREIPSNATSSSLDAAG